MHTLSHQAIADAIVHAVGVFGDGVGDKNDPALPRVTSAIASELRLGISALPGVPIAEDIRAYVLTLVSLKAIAGYQGDACRRGVERCLISAAAELRRHRIRAAI